MNNPVKKCGNGHAMTEANTYLRNGREPVCRACQAEYMRRSRARRAELKAQGIAIAPTPRASERERLLSSIQITPAGCWRWAGFVNRHGYGRTSFRGNRATPAHQAFYMLLMGPIPQGKVLDHLCHTRDTSCEGGVTCLHRRCVNPDHLEPVSSEENSSRGAVGRRTHCPKGHAYSDENTLVSNGRRYCRTCQRAHSKVQQEKRAARKKDPEAVVEGAWPLIPRQLEVSS